MKVEREGDSVPAIQYGCSSTRGQPTSCEEPSFRRFLVPKNLNSRNSNSKIQQKKFFAFLFGGCVATSPPLAFGVGMMVSNVFIVVGLTYH